MIWTVIPVKAPSLAKSRLAGSMSARPREGLVVALFDHVVSVAQEFAGSGRVLVVSPSPEMRARAQGHGAMTSEEEPEEGLNAGLARAAAAIPANDAMLVLPIDLPYLEPADLEAMLAVEAGAVLASDRSGTGTNALLLRRQPRWFHFGEESAARHRRALPGIATLTRPGLAFDLDTPDDLVKIHRSGSSQRQGPQHCIAGTGLILRR